jgi:starch synthase
MVEQKGGDLSNEIAATRGELPLQLVVLGTGHPRYERLFSDLAARIRNVCARTGFDVPLSRCIYAGSDFLMPGAFEPVVWGN